MAQHTVLITGASSGIGKALAHEFAAHGHRIIAVSENDTELEAAAREIRDRHSTEVLALSKDLADAAAPQALYDEIRAHGWEVDILVNNAGVGQRGTFHETALDDDIAIIRINIEALTRLTKLFLADMVVRGSGKILNTGSIAGFEPGPLFATYHASKAYVVSFSESIAEELKDTPITVTVLCPGPVFTPFFEKADAKDVRVLESGLPMKPEEVATAAYEALVRGERTVIPGALNKVMVFTRRMIPIALQAKINKQFYERSKEA